VREHDRVPVRLDLEDRLLGAGGNRGGRQLEEKHLPLGQGQDLSRPEQLRDLVVEVDLGAQEDLHADPGPGRLVDETLVPDPRPLDRGQEHAVQHVGRRDHRVDAVLLRDPEHLEGVLEIVGTVVEVGQDVRVEVDHGVDPA
jgi:hypothetical protein